MKAVAIAQQQSAPAMDAPVPSAKSQPQDFAKQLEKATKPTSKKAATDEEPTPPAPQPAPETTLAQILATLVGNANPNIANVVAPAPTVAPTTPTPVDDDVAIEALTSTTATATATAMAMATATAAMTASATAVATTNAASAPEPKLQQTIMQQLVAVTQELAPDSLETRGSSEPPLTPLEQAVHDMLSKLDHKSGAAKPDIANVAMQLAPPTTAIVTATTSSTEIKDTAPVAPMQQPQELVSQNHAHLVIDDPNGRVVMTVAIRGSEVNVSVRASDDTTAAALARNAGSLEDAMRGRGLQLAQFDSQRDLTREQREKPMYERKATVKKADSEQFTLLEETNS